MTTFDPIPPPEEPLQWTKLLLALLALTLISGNVFFALKTRALADEVASLRTLMKSEFGLLQGAAKSAGLEQQKTMDELRKTIEAAEARAEQAEVNAGSKARRYTDQLARRIATEQNRRIDSTSQQLQPSSQAAHQQLTAQIGEMKQAATQTSTQVSGIATEVTNVKTAVASTKSEVDRILSDMRSVRGDLGVQSGLVATNARELAALKALGERDYLEFQLSRTKTPQRVGEVSLQLKKLDAGRNRYTIDLLADDKKMEKKNRTINEPVQFYMAKARTPCEIVVNEVRRDKIIGYLSVPKVKGSRGF